MKRQMMYTMQVEEASKVTFVFQVANSYATLGFTFQEEASNTLKDVVEKKNYSSNPSSIFLEELKKAGLSLQHTDVHLSNVDPVCDIQCLNSKQQDEPPLRIGLALGLSIAILKDTPIYISDELIEHFNKATSEQTKEEMAHMVPRDIHKA